MSSSRIWPFYSLGIYGVTFLEGIETFEIMLGLSELD